MSELCNSSTTPQDSKFHTLVLFDIFYILSFIISHPLYLSYFIFFSPYLVKLLSFLYPLFLTTLLLLFTILSLSIHNNSTLKSPESNPGSLLSTFLNITVSRNTQENHEETYNIEEFEVYKIVFSHTPTSENHVAKEIRPLDQVSVSDSDSDSDCVTKFCTHEVSRVNVTAGEGKLESFQELLDKFEYMGKEKKVVDEPPCSKSNKVVGGLQKEDLITGSEATPIKVHINDNDCIAVNVSAPDNGGEYKSNEHLEKINNVGNVGEYAFPKLDGSRSYVSSIGSYGSMRKEKEWKRTLACKLFEERHNAGGEDGMDSLWETYETDLGNKDSKKVMMKSKSDSGAYANVNGNMNVNAKKNNRKNSGISADYYDFENAEEEDDDFELTNGKICCLQALKMSSGKMNFGMGKSNFVKISKALKGMGWIHNVSKHGKKR